MARPPQPRFRVRVASIDGRSVTSLCSLGLTPECAIHDIEQPTSSSFRPPAGTCRSGSRENTPLLPWLRKWHARGAYIAGVCTGVAFLAEGGLLDGRQATTHWGVAEILRQRYPKVLWRPEQFVTEDDRLFCSGGVYASIDLSLYLVEKFCGHEIALQCAKSLLVSMPRSRQSGYSVVPLSRPHSDDKIRQTEEYLQENFDRDVSIDVSPAASAWARAISSAASRPRPAACPAPTCRCCAYRPPRRCWSMARVSIQAVCTKIGYEDVAFFREPVQAPYRHDAGRVSQPLCADESRARRIGPRTVRRLEPDRPRVRADGPGCAGPRNDRSILPGENELSVLRLRLSSLVSSRNAALASADIAKMAFSLLERTRESAVQDSGFKGCEAKVRRIGPVPARAAFVTRSSMRDTAT